MMKTMTISPDRDPMNRVLSAVQAAGSVLLFCHISPDGDTLGSAMALCLRFGRLGKDARVVLDGDTPANLRFLEAFAPVLAPEEAREPVDLAIAVDVSCRERLGACEAAFAAARHTAVVDHHGTNTGFSEADYIDGDAPAAAVLVFRMLRAMGGSLSREEAVCLYTALATDTGNFIYAGTNAESFSMMADLMEAGLPLAEYSRRLFRTKALPFVRLLGLALPSLRLSCGGKAAGIRLTAAQLAQAGAEQSHADGVVDYAIDLHGVQAAYFARELGDGRVKVSLRSVEPYHVDGVAARFGGGGHKLASGLTVSMPLDEVASAVEAALADELESRV